MDLSLLYKLGNADVNIMQRVSELGKSFEKESEELLNQNYALVERLAQTLLEEDILSGSEIMEVLKESV